ncbi:hypothetical protein [Clostridium massiliamazoniense]|nr:hypothetical protein [Clostridium massiliamazoniense]
MRDNLFKEYKINSKVDSILIDKYIKIIPEELISVWEIYGFGSILKGTVS